MIYTQFLKSLYTVLHTLGSRIAQDKTYIGRVSKGFDFLGFHCCPTGMTVSEAALSRQDHKIARLDEQGASKERVGTYLRRWLRWARTIVVCGTIGVLAFGCSLPVTTMGEKIANKEITAQIKVGVSVKEDVRRILGEPHRSLYKEEGEEQWLYYYREGDEINIYNVRFTRAGIVKEKGYSRSR